MTTGVTDQIYYMDDGTTGTTSYSGPAFGFSTNSGYQAACNGGYTQAYYGSYICTSYTTPCTYATTMFVRNEADPESSEVSLGTSGGTGFTWIQRDSTSLNIKVNRSNILANGVSTYKNKSYVVHWRYAITTPGSTSYWD